MLPKKAVCLQLTVLSIVAVAAEVSSSSSSSSSVHQRKDRSFGQSYHSLGGAASTNLQHDPRFDPDVLNRFLEEYANKMKRTTERSSTAYQDEESKYELEAQDFESQIIDVNVQNNTETVNSRDILSTLNDTLKKQKLYNTDPHGDNRNSGWVTLDAIPWSKSKISKWQANPTTQPPWPEFKPWDKPSFTKPWNTEFPSRPPSYESTKPWQNKLTKPYWSDNSPSASNKPWYSQERPRPVQQQDHPSYPPVNKYEDNPNQAQKWPPERPTWDRYTESSRPSSDIITDNGPPNFPNSNWDLQEQRPGYMHHTESYASQHGGWNDRNDFSNNKFNRPNSEDSGGYYDRPHFSHYQYPTSNDHPSNHPAMGDGQWILLSTNRGYTKPRQRSIKLDALQSPDSKSNDDPRQKQLENNREKQQQIPTMTSKRQVRLTVLPSINGTNTTISHGGLLEVERTFKTVDQSRKEYEMEKSNYVQSIKSNPEILLNKRPIRNTVIGSTPSTSAVLAAVGAGMLPATMAMMIPMMLGRRRKRSALVEEDQISDIVYINIPKDIFIRKVYRQRI